MSWLAHQLERRLLRLHIGREAAATEAREIIYKMGMDLWLDTLIIVSVKSVCVSVLCVKLIASEAVSKNSHFHIILSLLYSRIFIKLN